MRRALLLISLLFMPVDQVNSQTPGTWRLSLRPILEIGTQEGDPDYELHQAISSVRLADGRIVVLNAGAHELRFYDAHGKFLHKQGRKGKGPGEYNFPARLYYTARDSMLVYDVSPQRETHLDSQGRMAGLTGGASENDSPFKRDAWMYGRNFVDGPANTNERERVRRALQQLPALPPGAYRHVLVDPWYRLWVREQRMQGEPTQRWSIYTAKGQPLASLKTPETFEIHQIGPDFLLGRARKALDVEFIQLYALATPGWQVKGDYFTPVVPQVSGQPAAPVPQEILFALRSYVRNMASQQEIYYSNPASKYRYASDIAQLEMPEDKSLTAHMLYAHDRGWGALVVHRESNVMCAMSAGMGGPLGWPGGVAICGEPASK